MPWQDGRPLERLPPRSWLSNLLYPRLHVLGVPHPQYQGQQTLVDGLGVGLETLSELKVRPRLDLMGDLDDLAGRRPRGWVIRGAALS